MFIALNNVVLSFADVGSELTHTHRVVGICLLSVLLFWLLGTASVVFWIIGLFVQ